MGDEEGKCSFGRWQCVCFDGLTEDGELVLAINVSISVVRLKVLCLELEADQVQLH